MWFNDRENLCYLQPETIEDRATIARDFLREADYGIPLYLDGLDDRAMELYGAWPERLYGLGSDGLIRYQGSPGPWRFNPGGLERWLEGLDPNR